MAKTLERCPQAIKLFNENGFKTIVITNQSGIARGYLTEEMLVQIHCKMEKELARYGAFIDAIYHCPHHPEEGCYCRKPSPELLLRAAQDFDIDLSLSYMIGDMESDIEAGKNAGCKTAFVRTGQKAIVGYRELNDSYFGADYSADSLFEVARWII